MNQNDSWPRTTAIAAGGFEDGQQQRLAIGDAVRNVVMHRAGSRFGRRRSRSLLGAQRSGEDGDQEDRQCED